MPPGPSTARGSGAAPCVPPAPGRRPHLLLSHEPRPVRPHPPLRAGGHVTRTAPSVHPGPRGRSTGRHTQVKDRVQTRPLPQVGDKPT